jgi:hypothetical protein
VRRLLVLGLAVLALALVAAGCGGDDDGAGSSEGTDLATWAAGFCQALEDLGESISEVGSGLAGDGLPSSEEVTEAVENAGAAVSTFGDDLRELGTPDLPSGEEISSRLETATDEARQAFEEVEDEVGPIEDASDVAVAAGAIAEATQKALTAVGQATANLEELDSDGTLRAELEDAAECAGLSS